MGKVYRTQGQDTQTIDDLIKEVNGNLDNVNVVPGADIEMSKLENFTDWTDWTPSYGGIGAMTYTTVTTTFAKYCRIGNMVYIMWNCIGTTGGVANSGITFTLPVASNAGAWNIRGACWGSDGATYTACAHQNPNNNTMAIYKTGAGNWGLGASRRIMGQCFYTVA